MYVIMLRMLEINKTTTKISIETEMTQYVITRNMIYYKKVQKSHEANKEGSFKTKRRWGRTSPYVCLVGKVC